MKMIYGWLAEISDGLLTVATTQFTKVNDDLADRAILIYFVAEIIALHKSPDWRHAPVVSVAHAEIKLDNRPDLQLLRPVINFIRDSSFLYYEHWTASELLIKKFNDYCRKADSKRYQISQKWNPMEYLPQKDKRGIELLGQINHLILDLEILLPDFIPIILDYISDLPRIPNQHQIEPVTVPDQHQIKLVITLPVKVGIGSNLKKTHFDFGQIIARLFKTIQNFPAFLMQMSWFDDPGMQQSVLRHDFNGTTLCQTATNTGTNINRDVSDWIKHTAFSWPIPDNADEIKKEFKESEGHFNSLLKAVQENHPLPKIKNLLGMLTFTKQKVVLSTKEQLLIYSAQRATQVFLKEQYHQLSGPT